MSRQQHRWFQPALWWPRLKALWRRWTGRIPPTGRGWLLLAVAGLSLWFYGLGSLDLLLFVIGVAGLLLVFLASLTVFFAAGYLRRKGAAKGMDVHRLEAGVSLATGFGLPSLARLPLVQIAWGWETPAEIAVENRWAGSLLLEEVVARRRCLSTSVERVFTVSDAFGLAALRWRRREPTLLMILPSVGRLRDLPVVQSLAAAEGIPHPAGAAEGDRMEFRRYEPGDSIRHILWKTYARTGELNVRLPERSVFRAQRTVAYLVTGPEDEAAAAAARVALQSGALGEHWTFGADGTREPSEEVSAALRAIARSGSPEAGDGLPPAAGLAPFLRRVLATGDAHCIVFAPVWPGPWVETVIAVSRAHPGVLSFVLGTDGIVRPRREPLWRRLLWLRGESEGASTEDVATVVRALSASGSAVVVVDRASGRTYGRGYQQVLGLAV